MNDFTKEELFEILGLASNACGIKGRTMPIFVKLQSMIDNYDDKFVMVRGEKRHLSEFDDE